MAPWVSLGRLALDGYAKRRHGSGFPFQPMGSTQGSMEALGGGRQWWVGVAAVKICSRLWLAMPRMGRPSRTVCRNWNGPLLATRSTSSAKVMVLGRMSQGCGQGGTRPERGMCAREAMGVGWAAGGWVWKPRWEGEPVYVDVCKDVGLSCVHPRSYVWVKMSLTACTDVGSQGWGVSTAVSGKMGTGRLECQGTNM